MKCLIIIIIMMYCSACSAMSVNVVDDKLIIGPSGDWYRGSAIEYGSLGSAIWTTMYTSDYADEHKTFRIIDENGINQVSFEIDQYGHYLINQESRYGIDDGEMVNRRSLIIDGAREATGWVNGQMSGMFGYSYGIARDGLWWAHAITREGEVRLGLHTNWGTQPVTITTEGDVRVEKKINEGNIGATVSLKCGNTQDTGFRTYHIEVVNGNYPAVDPVLQISCSPGFANEKTVLFRLDNNGNLYLKGNIVPYSNP